MYVCIRRWLALPRGFVGRLSWGKARERGLRQTTRLEKKELRKMEGNRPRRASLKAHNTNWKEKLRENCLKRVQKERSNLLWKIRSTGQQAPDGKDIVESAFRDIVSDELQKIKQSSINDSAKILASKTHDVIWEYDGMHVDSNTSGSENEDLLLEMERLLYEDLREESIRKELKTYEEEDEYLARAVFEHMHLNDGQVCSNDKVWCPICKRGELREAHHLIYCTSCLLRLDLENDKVGLEFLRDRLGKVHMEHLDRGCKLAPKFCMETVFDLTALYIKCEACKTFEIVL